MNEAGEGAGKSGNFFFYTSDNKFLIKTMTDDDKDALLNIIDDYYSYLK